MPKFGAIDGALLQNLDDWQAMAVNSADAFSPATPSRVVWIAASNCTERYQLFEAEIINPET